MALLGLSIEIGIPGVTRSVVSARPPTITNQNIAFHSEMHDRAEQSGNSLCCNNLLAIPPGLCVAVVWGGEPHDEHQANSCGGEPDGWT